MVSRMNCLLIFAWLITLNSGVRGASTCRGSYDLVVRNGTVALGDESAAFLADIAITGNRIACVGYVTEAGTAEIIDATGLYVTPGFVDVHSHADIDITRHPLAANLLAQGITTVVGGNCGGHSYPIAELLASVAMIQPGVNFATLAGHNTIRYRVMGYAHSPTDDQIDKMKLLVEQEMKAGAFGLSTGLAYRPGLMATTEEVIALAEVAARYGGIYATHSRDEGDGIRDSILEAIRIGEVNQMRIQISHIKLITEKTWHQTFLIRQPIEAAHQRGLRVTTDQHPYSATATSLLSLIPSWAWGGGFEDFLSFLARAESHALLVRHYASFFPFAFDRFLVSACPSQREIEGLTFRAILEARGEAVTAENGAALLIELQATGRAQGVFFVIQEQDIDSLVTLPYNMIASDSYSVTIEDGGLPHPRNFGTFPYALQRFVVERKVLSLEEAVRKMTSLPARTFGLEGRGTLCAGSFADLVIFDLKSIHDNATYTDPFHEPTGIRMVVVNGRVAVREGIITGVRAGQVLYGPGKEQPPTPNDPKVIGKPIRRIRV